MARTTPVNAGYNIINGTSTGSNASKVDCWLEWKVTAQNADANYSVVDLYLYAASTVSSSTSWSSPEWFGYVKCDDEHHSMNTTYDFSNYKVNCFGHHEFTIYHNSDGQKTVTLSGAWETSHSSYISGGSASGSVELPALITACTAPTWFTLSPEKFNKVITLSWGGAQGGRRNDITGYDTQLMVSPDGIEWPTQWGQRGVDESSPSTSQPGMERGYYVKYRIRTIGTAGEGYYSDWVESNVVQKSNAHAYISKDGKIVPHAAYIHNGNEYVRHLPHVYKDGKWVLCSE